MLTTRPRAGWAGFLLALALLRPAAAAPQVFWASDPVRPGETVLLRGAGFSAQPQIAVSRLADGQPGQPAAVVVGAGQAVASIQPSDVSVKFILPATLAPGVIGWTLKGTGGTVSGLLNRPAVWWAQGNTGLTASPGGWLRLFGKNLAWDKSATKVRLQGPRTIELTATADAFAARVTLPAGLAAGEYQVFVHSGKGGPAAWSTPLPVTIAAAEPWPQTVINVKECGADGTGQHDDTEAIRAALAKAAAAGGGVVYFPRGRYQATATLTIPRRTVLRGESQTLSCVFWPDVPAPPKAWLEGTNSFGIEDLTFYCSNYLAFLVGQVSGPDAGDVFLRRVRIRANVFRGHMDAKEVDRRWQVGLKDGFGGGYWLAKLGGRNLEVSDCDLYSSSCLLSFTQPRGARIERNILGMGRWGGSGVFGGDGVVIENNKYIGCDLMAWGAAGGLGYGNLSHVYLAHNSFALEHGGDREPITSDASGEVYHGPLATADATSITLPAPPKDTNPRYLGGAVYVVAGTGEGQWRTLTAFDGARLKVEPAWTVTPDSTSVVAVTWKLDHWLLLDNDFADTGMAIQLYGEVIEHICAGNRSSRTAGYHNFGMDYHGIEPSWYVQWLDNEILEGNLYNADHDNIRLTGDAHLGTYGLIGPQWKLPIVLGTIMRRNHLHNNSSLVVGTELPTGKVTPNMRTDPLVCDTIVENNLVENCDVGLYLYQTTRGTYLAGNRFERVGLPIWDEARVLQGEQERRQKLLRSQGPIAQWDFDRAVVDAAGRIRTVPDATGNGFEAAGTNVKQVAGRQGKAAQLAGDGYLTVNEPGYLNLQTVTVALWARPDTVKGRHGLFSKRYRGTGAPYIMSIWDGALEFEGNAVDGKWSFNFRTPPLVKAGEWSHFAAVVEAGRGVTIYLNGAAIGQLANPLDHTLNGEPFIIGREAWGGLPNQQDPPAFFSGLIGPVKLWARALSPAEIKAEAAP